MINSNHLTQVNNYQVSHQSSSSLSFFSKPIATDNSATITVTTKDSCLLSGDNRIATVNHHDEQQRHAINIEQSGKYIVIHHLYKHY